MRPTRRPSHSRRKCFASRYAPYQSPARTTPQKITCGHAAPSPNQPWLKASVVANSSGGLVVAVGAAAAVVVAVSVAGVLAPGSVDGDTVVSVSSPGSTVSTGAVAGWP